jgi:hypothetical protein
MFEEAKNKNKDSKYPNLFKWWVWGQDRNILFDDLSIN